MERTLIWSLGVAILFAACSNEGVPGAMTPGVGMTGAAGMLAVPTAPGMTAGTGSTSPITTSPGAAGMAAPMTGGQSTSGAAGSAPGAAGSAPVTGAAGMAAAGSGVAGAPAMAMAGTGAGEGAAGTVATAGTGAPASGFKPKCIKKGVELALIGDSWINYPLGEFLAPRLASRAQKDGALAQGDSYNDQAVAGTSLASGGLGLIPDQWPAAKSAAERAGTKVKFVVMDGGGNDVLLGNQICLENGKMRDQDPSCQRTVMAATMAGQMLQMKMRADGVGQGIYFFYPHVPAGGWDVLDYALPMAKATCESMNDENYQCYFIDTREAFQGPGNTGVAMASLIGPDGIHPNAAGDDVLADLIWKTMKEKCMAQTEQSGGGCCTPEP